MAILDTETVTVATVQASTAVGHLTESRYWNDVTQLFQTTPPTNVVAGSKIGVCAYGQNDMASEYLKIWMDFTWYKNGVETEKVIGTFDGYATPPGIQKPIISEHLNAESGTWTVKVDMHGEVA